MRTLAILALCAGCAHQPARVALRGEDVLQHLQELGTDGQADIVTMRVDGTTRKFADNEHVFLYATVEYRSQPTTLAKVLEGCGPFTSTTPCTLRPSELIVLPAAERVREPEPRQPRVADPTPHTNGYNPDVARVSGALTLASLAGVGICLAICEDHKAAISISLGAAALVGAVIWAVASGARD